MISCKHITKLVGVMMAAAVAFCMWLTAFTNEAVEALGAVKTQMQYEEELFDTKKPMQIDIQMAQEEWEEMLKNAKSEEYYSCDVLINDQKLYNVGVRPKGNTSLTAIAENPDTDRFSFKLEFDHYVEGQTCLGLDKLILNNNYADATNMKEALVYDMYQYLGADASLYNYAEISVNGEYLGVYLALEAVEESFLLRNYGTAGGELYKPDGMQMGGAPDGGELKGQPPRNGETISEEGKSEFGGGMPFGGGESDFAQEGGQKTSRPGEKDAAVGKERQQENDKSASGEPPEADSRNGETISEEGKSEFGGGMPFDGGEFDFAQEEGQRTPQTGEKGDAADRGNGKPHDFGKMPGGGDSAMGGENGANLNYTDEELSSYSDIWDGEVTNTGKQDHSRVVTALKNISEGTDLETYLDVDNVLKYMAVHTFSVNLDSLSGNMAHNYYLYEYNGMLNVLPWDYNLAFGGMNQEAENGATDVVNDAVDTPFQGTAFFDALLENETYLSRYHEYLDRLAKEYVLGGRFQQVYERIRNQIDTLVKTDPTALYSYEEYEAGAKMLYQTVLLRAESVSGQLDGTIPATDEGQRADSSMLVDASEIDISVMGVMDMGGGEERKSARAADRR